LFLVGVGVIDRKQLSMVLPAELIEAIKQRAHGLGLSITAYVSALVRADLGQVRVEQLERLAASNVGLGPVDPL
jgi:hypothetical protein